VVGKDDVYFFHLGRVNGGVERFHVPIETPFLHEGGGRDEGMGGHTTRAQE
jgi:hypothetical protein